MPESCFPDGSVRILTNQEDVEVFVDGELKAINTPVSIKLPNGRYQIKVKYEEDSRVFDILITDGIIILKEFEFDDSGEKGRQKSTESTTGDESQGLRNFFALKTGTIFKYQMTVQGKNEGQVHFYIDEKNSTETEDIYELQMIIFSEYYESNKKIIKPGKKYRFCLIASSTSALVTHFYKLPSDNRQGMMSNSLRFEISEAELPIKNRSKFVFSITDEQLNMKEFGHVISDSTEVIVAGKVMRNVLKAQFKIHTLEAVLFIAYGLGPIRLNLIDNKQEAATIELIE